MRYWVSVINFGEIQMLEMGFLIVSLEGGEFFMY